MFRSDRFIATGFAIIALGSTAAAADPATRYKEGPFTLAASAPTRSGDVVEITNLRPFTHTAYIPAGVDLSSIKIERIKMVKLAVKRRSVTNPRYCDPTWSEPGGSMYCPQVTDESQVPAYEVTYSFRGQPMASDEYGNTYFTFSVYFRPDEINAGLRQALSSSKISRTDASEYFQLTTSRDSIQQVAIDEANSTFCDGNYVDGNWTRTNPKCEDRIAYTKVASASPYITVKIDPASRFETVSAASRAWPK